MPLLSALQTGTEHSHWLPPKTEQSHWLERQYTSRRATLPPHWTIRLNGAALPLAKTVKLAKKAVSSSPIGLKTSQWRQRVYKGPTVTRIVTLLTSYSSLTATALPD